MAGTTLCVSFPAAHIYKHISTIVPRQQTTWGSSRELFEKPSRFKRNLTNHHSQATRAESDLTTLKSRTTGRAPRPTPLHHGTFTIKLQAMSSALASKASVPLATLLPRALGTAPRNHIRASQPSLHRCPFSRPNQAAMQLRHLGGNPRVRPQASATTSENPASSKKEGRLSVLDRMGANQTTKIVIIVFLSIYGTMETIFYANAAYRYFSKEESE